MEVVGVNWDLLLEKLSFGYYASCFIQSLYSVMRVPIPRITV